MASQRDDFRLAGSKKERKEKRATRVYGRLSRARREIKTSTHGLRLTFPANTTKTLK